MIRSLLGGNIKQPPVRVGCGEWGPDDWKTLAQSRPITVSPEKVKENSDGCNELINFQTNTSVMEKDVEGLVVEKTQKEIDEEIKKKKERQVNL